MLWYIFMPYLEKQFLVKMKRFIRDKSEILVEKYADLEIMGSKN